MLDAITKPVAIPLVVTMCTGCVAVRYDAPSVDAYLEEVYPQGPVVEVVGILDGVGQCCPVLRHGNDVYTLIIWDPAPQAALAEMELGDHARRRPNRRERMKPAILGLLWSRCQARGVTRSTPSNRRESRGAPLPPRPITGRRVSHR
jgi:hypothetical protein